MAQYRTFSNKYRVEKLLAKNVTPFTVDNNRPCLGQAPGCRLPCLYVQIVNSIQDQQQTQSCSIWRVLFIQLHVMTLILVHPQVAQNLNINHLSCHYILLNMGPLKRFVFWDMILYSPLKINQNFWGTYLHLQGRRRARQETCVK
jgi:hypothetical protein